IESSNISFICVSTPTKENGEIDSTLLEKALAEKENRELMTIWMRGMFDEEEAKRKGFLYKTL
ncbi:MAG: hypothetical protein KAT65_00250, partial [Methanophagales archaeon]|nr:hypothetical protein [Methanophagales archaeon]